MSMLKNITNAEITLQVFNTNDPVVNGVSVSPVITLQPGEVVQEATILVIDTSDVSYNKDLIDGYIAKQILTRI